MENHWSSWLSWILNVFHMGLFHTWIRKLTESAQKWQKRWMPTGITDSWLASYRSKPQGQCKGFVWCWRKKQNVLLSLNRHKRVTYWKIHVYCLVLCLCHCLNMRPWRNYSFFVWYFWHFVCCGLTAHNYELTKDWSMNDCHIRAGLCVVSRIMLKSDPKSKVHKNNISILPSHWNFEGSPLT